MLSQQSRQAHPNSLSYPPHSDLSSDHTDASGRKRALSEIEDDEQNQQSGVRRRISRACDQCNQLRTKCDGSHPCKHCQDNQLICKYARVHKKRGRVPKRDQEHNDESRGVSSPADLGVKDDQIHTNSVGSFDNVPMSSGNVTGTSMGWNGSTNGMPTHRHGMGFSTENSQNIFNSNTIPMGTTQTNNSALSLTDFADFTMTDFGAAGMAGFEFPLGDDYSVAFMGKPPTFESPEWFGLTPSLLNAESQVAPASVAESIKYPVLKPLLPHLGSILLPTQACTLLEQYFNSSTPAYFRSSNPYLPANIFRKKSVLHPTQPRPCTPALLASMIWITAQTSDAGFLTAQVDTRGRICQRLLDLIVGHLRPLIHTQPSASNSTADYDQVPSADAGLDSLVQPTIRSGIGGYDRTQVDNLATYIHLATVVSASERKAASLRWWNAAWSLAREVRLGRELPTSHPETDQNYNQVNGGDTKNLLGRPRGSFHDQPAHFVSEEIKEERRRVWWLLYMQDRHLALCYNRPMFFLNKECESLLQPLDDDTWQSDSFNDMNASDRKQGLNIECTSHSVFGFFLPLMIILGEILDLNHTRNRPRLGPKARQPKNWDEQVDEITELLEIYEKSLDEFVHFANTNATPSSTAGGSNAAFNASELSLRTQTVMAYGKHILHVLHILLTGKWDPIALLDDNDLWISTQAFVTATGHAVEAAKAVGEIIEHDPDLSLMPYFFGIYLLQGSFLLLLFADKLAGNVSTEVVRACETISRAHEACIATLNTQYQRNFRKVMRSALQQVRGRLADDAAEQQSWRRQVLALYRWTGDGTGLAL